VARPDAVVLVSTAEAGVIARQLRERGIGAQLVGTRPVEQPSLLAEPGAEGLVFSAPALDPGHPFFARFEEEHGEPAGFFAAEAYDAITTLAQAADVCGPDPACLERWYAGRTFDGALGPVRFDEDGNAHYPYVLKRVRGGRFERLER
jgi:ABC-type branched-subunit amino acid transport system substrate-binding protein